MRSYVRAALLPVCTGLLSLMFVTSALLSPPSAAAATSRESRLLARVNHARATHGLAPLRARAGLMRYAHEHARQMAARRAMFHTTSWNVICCWSAVGENVAYDITVRRVHIALMHSAPHRAHLLNPLFREVGVGVVESGGQLWVTEVFRRPA